MTTIFWAGDSTCQQNDASTYPQTGIAQMFDRYTTRGAVVISNHAVNGRSTRSFLDEGRLVPIYHDMCPGDFLFIQFGHNDEKESDPARYASADGAYAENLEKFINAARNKGATPVIITPLCRRLFAEKDESYRHTEWANAAKKTAARLGAACIDLTALSERLVTEIGAERAERFYMNLPAGMYPNFPNGQTDNTHLQPEGAMAFGALIADALVALGGAYANLIAPEYVRWSREKNAVNAEEEREK